MLRIKVIKFILRCFLKFYYRDYINSLNVFYYCFWLGNDDEECVKYLKIFFKEKDVVKWLNEDDLIGNKVLYIVV